MKNRLIQFAHSYFGPALDFRVRLFNVLAVGGTLVSLAMAVVGVGTHAGWQNIAGNTASACLSYALLRYSRRTGRYQLCYLITIVAIFIGLFPFLFFTAGGYHSGMPSFFVFAVAFTILMLPGKKAVLMSALELLLYFSICIVAFFHPGYVNAWGTEQDLLTDVILGFVSVSVVLGAMLYFHFKLYNEQQRQLAEQNVLLGQLNRMKTELFGNISHELKTPLTVISVHTQRAEALLELGRQGDIEKIRESHALVQEEVMRLSRLVDSTLRLASLQETGEQKTVQDLCHILRTTAEAYRSLLEKKGNLLQLALPQAPVQVVGNADQLVQLISNLLSNAATHTQQGQVCVGVMAAAGAATITVQDTGVGIAPQLLAHVFERGVTDGRGSGLGLAICRQIVKGHGGTITIDSTQNKGTAVTVVLPLHQKGGADAESKTAAC